MLQGGKQAEKHLEKQANNDASCTYYKNFAPHRSEIGARPKATVEKMRVEWRKMSSGLPEGQRSAADNAMNRQFAKVTSPEMRSFILYDPAETLCTS